MRKIYDSSEYKRSRAAYTMQATFEYLITIFISDAFLAKLLTSIGISDSVIGIISSIITIAFLFQLLAIFLVDKIKRNKQAALIFTTSSQLFFMVLYLIPFFSISKSAKTTMAVFLILGAYLCQYLIASILFKWANSFVAPYKRAQFSATKEMISLATGMLFTFFAGKLVDFYDKRGQLDMAFIAIAIIIFALCAFNFISLLLISGKSEERESKHIPLKKVISNTLGNKNFRNVVILTCIWESARYLTIGFLGTYKTKELLMSVGTVQIINICGNLGRFLMSNPFGRFSDKYSFATGMKVAFIIAGVAFGINIFSAPGCIWPIVIYTILYAVSMAGLNANSMNIVYSYVDADYFVHATAIKNSIGGVCGFLATLVGSKVVEIIQNSGNMVFGQTIYAQQFLSGISFVITILCIIFVSVKLEKQEVLKQ